MNVGQITHVSYTFLDQIEGYAPETTFILAQSECFISCWGFNSACVENTQKDNG